MPATKSSGKTARPKKTAGRFRIKRVYEPAGKDDGLRVPTTVYNALNERHEAIDALLAPLGKQLGASQRHADVHIVS